MLKSRTAIWTFVFTTVLMSVAPTAWSCSNMGPGKHVGVVTTSDPGNGILVITDAETRKPIRFVSSGELLRQVDTDDTVIVTFTTHEGQLIAKEIVVHLSRTNPVS